MTLCAQGVQTKYEFALKRLNIRKQWDSALVKRSLPVCEMFSADVSLFAVRVLSREIPFFSALTIFDVKHAGH